jgi:hypothetical protein
MRRLSFTLLIAFLMIASTFLEAYIIVLNNGRKIYSAKPFEVKEDGVYFTLPNDMLIFIRKDDIDFNATKEINKPKIKPAANVKVDEKKPAETPRADVVEPKPVQSEAMPTGTKTQTIEKTEPAVQQPVKPIENTIKDSNKKQLPQSQPRPAVKITDFGIPVESIDKSSITLDQLIEISRKVEWVYEGKCQLCEGTGKSSLSTGSVELVCTYCNGTGKGGKWNDDNLKIGDDCPWCVLGYDELSRGPCKNCLGTGRYMGLDRLRLFEFPENKNEGVSGRVKDAANDSTKGGRR